MSWIDADHMSARLLRFRAGRLPEAMAERLFEEWLAETARMSNLGKLAFAVSLLLTRNASLVDAGNARETNALARAVAAGDQRYVAANLSRRFVASLVDFAFVSPLGIIPYLVFTASPATDLLVTLVYSVLLLALDTWLVLRYGGSVGKLMMKLRVIATDSQTVMLRHALGRALPAHVVFGMLQSPLVVLVWAGTEVPGYGALSSVERSEVLQTLAPAALVNGLDIFALAWLVLEIMMARTDPDHRSLHDRIGRTMVVYRDPVLLEHPDSPFGGRAPIAAR